MCHCQGKKGSEGGVVSSEEALSEVLGLIYKVLVLVLVGAEARLQVAMMGVKGEE